MPKVNGRGSKIQRDKSKRKSERQAWTLSVSVGKDPITGKYAKRRRDFEGTASEAESALRRFIFEIESDQVRTNSKSSFEAVAENWMALRRSDGVMHVEPNTQRTDKERLKPVIALIGHAEIAKITPDTIQRTYAALLRGDTPSGRPASGTYVRDIHSKVTGVFKWAVREGMVPFNPCQGVRLPDNTTEERKAMSDAQMRTVMGAMDIESPTETALLLCTMMGLRRGEAVGLSWGDVDFDGKVVNVWRAYTDGGDLKRTKGKKGRRVLPLTQSVEEVLGRRRVALERQFVKAAAAMGKQPEEHAVGPDTPICCDALGERTKPHSVTTHWRRIRTGFGLDGYTPHELRHSYLSALAKKKVDPKVLQEIAGHEKYSTTMDIYVHVDVEDKRAAMELF